MTDETGQKRPRSRFWMTVRIAIIVFVGANVAGWFLLRGWEDMYTRFFESEAPEVEFSKVPPGIGNGAVNIELALRDDGSGLDEVVARLMQKNRSKEIFRQPLSGASNSTARISFSGDKENLEEGVAILEVRVFDRSFWSNTFAKELKFKVDFRKPRVEVVTAQHNSGRGGSQLVFYRAFDQDLARSGARVGTQTYWGYPAGPIDPELTDPDLYAAIYAVKLSDDPKKVPLKVFAEDQVGNSVSTGFVHSIWNRYQRRLKTKIDPELVRRAQVMAAESAKFLDKQGSEASRAQFNFDADPGIQPADLIALRKVVLDLRRIGEEELSGFLAQYRSDPGFVSQNFLRPQGTEQLSYGDQLSFMYGEESVAEIEAKGPSFSVVRDKAGAVQPAVASNSGKVIFSGDLPYYGRTVIVDHGLGVCSVYASLSDISVALNSQVKRGQAIGLPGRTGFVKSDSMVHEIRVNGVPVDPREWWDEKWFEPHILKKQKEVKRTLGLNYKLPNAKEGDDR